MRFFIKVFVLIAITSFTSYTGAVACVTYHWTGAADSDWNNSANWEELLFGTNAVPQNDDNVVIDQNEYGSAPAPVLSSTVDNPMNITIRNGGDLTLNNSINTGTVTVSGAGNQITVNNGATLGATDFAVSSMAPDVTLSGAGSIDLSGDLTFSANANLTNNMTGNVNVGGNVNFQLAGGNLYNNGNITITGDLIAGVANNHVYNYSGAVLDIGGDVSFNSAASYIDNDGTINQAGNYSGIPGAVGILLNNKSTGTWNWTYTGGSPDPDMVSALAIDGTMIYGGNGNQSIVAIAYKNLTISGSGTKQLQGATSVTGTLDLSAGYLALNDADLTLESTSSVTNASASHFVVANGTGKLIQNNIGPGGRTGDVLFPVGVSSSSYTPLIINNSGTADNYSVSMASAIYDNGWSGTAQTSDVVNRTWFIEEEVVGGSDVALTFQWNTSEQLSGFSPAETKVIHYNGAEWEIISTGAASGSGPYSMSASGITSFSPFGVEGTNGVLPVELLYFKAEMKNDDAVLDWATATELNNDFFTIEKTTDLENFEAVGTVAGNGTTEARNDYRFYDKNPSAGVSYYRLKQTDFDGAYTYSDIVKITNEKVVPGAVADMNLYPVPNNGEYLKLQVSGLDINQEIPVLVYNIHGQVVYQQSILINNNEGTTLSFQEKLPQGMYTVRINTQEPLVRHFAVR